MSDAGFDAAIVTERPRIDRLDPRTRVLASFAVVVALVATRSPLVLAGALGVLVCAAAVSGHSARALLHRLAHVEGFLVVLLVLLPLTVPGPAIAALGPVAISEPGLVRAGTLFLRVNGAALAVFTLLGGLEPIRFGHALARLGLPEKLVHLLLFTARWVSEIGEEARRLHEALRARAFRPTTSRHGLRTLAHVAGRLVVAAIERAERVDEAMRCRAFAGRFALVDRNRFGAIDLVFAAGLTIGLTLLLATDRWT
ncbi:MAG: cobalt ECF transporter T component CbiQ [Hyphomicrobiales bacterium]|nr:cobalt ECF transporter T component CbiQ [Hyphomicrobiales bacterium]